LAIFFLLDKRERERERERASNPSCFLAIFFLLDTRERERDELMDVSGGVGGGVLDSCCNSVRGMLDEQIVVA
jgi:hypothetical protein